MSSNHVKQLFKFIENSPSCFHAIKTITEELKNEGFVEIKEKDTWQIEQGKKYYVTRNLSSVIAFKIPQNDFKSFILKVLRIHHTHLVLIFLKLFLYIF